MTLSDRIRVRLGHGFATKAIAAELGCRVEYVRAVKQRLKGPSVAQKNYAPRRRERDRERWAQDAEYRERRSHAHRGWRANRARLQSA